MNMQERRIKTGQVELQIQDTEREGDALILLHFGDGNLMMWQRAVPLFQDQYRLILVDLRGHGRSDKPPNGYHIDDMASDVIGLMAHLGLECAHIVGSSLGAEVGLSIAANAPSQVCSLVCEGALYSEYGPYGIWEGSEAEFKDHVAQELENMQNTPDLVFPSIDALIAHRRQIFKAHGWWNEAFEAFESYGACKIGEGQFTCGWRKWAREYMAHYFACRFEDYYSRVNCPVLMLAGEEEWNDAQSRNAMEKLSRLARRAQIAVIPGWVHPYGWLVDPEGISKMILAFLASSSPNTIA